MSTFRAQYEEWKKKQNEDGTSSSSNSSFANQYRQWKVQSGNLDIESIGNEINERVNTWLQNNNNFLSNYNTRFSGENTSYRGDASDWLSTITTQKTNFEKEAENIKSLVEQYKDYFNEDFVGSVTQALDGNLKVQGDVLSASTKDFEYWSQWETEDAYKQWVAEQEDYNAKLTYDLEAGQKEIEELEAFIESYQIDTGKKDDEKWYEKIGRYLSGSTVDTTLPASLTTQAAQDQSRFGEDYQQAMELLSEKKAYYTLAERVQKAAELASVADVESENYDLEFENYAQKGLNYTNPSINDAEKGKTLVNKATYAKEHSDMIGVGEVNGGGSDIVNYYHSFMTDEEIKIYSYYFGKGDYAKADEYLESLEESLQARHGTMMGEQIKGKPVLEYAFAVAAGLDQFTSGVKNIFSDADYIPTNATQVASGIIREDLADTGAKLPDWLGGSSVGQVGYDVINTTSNMLPSILVGTAVNAVAPGAGAVVGAALMGASAGGNAKAEMLNLGYSKKQANTYGVMVAIAEGGMEYLLGGISKLGGKATGNVISKALSKVDNAFARTAIKIGGSMASEGFEEGLQTVIEPWLKEIATGVDWDDPNIDEVLYSSLLGALSAFGLEGAGTVAGEVNTYKQGKNVQQIYAGVEKLQKLGQTFSADTVAYRIANKVNAQTDAYTIGRLLNEVGGTISEQNLTDIVNGLTERGINAKHAKVIAKKFQESLNEDMSMPDEIVKEIYKNLSPLADVLRTNIIGANTTVYQRTRAYSDLISLANEVSNGKKGVSADKSSTAKETNVFEEYERYSQYKDAAKVSRSERVINNQNYEATSVANEAVKQKLGVQGNYSSEGTGNTRLKSNNKSITVAGIASLNNGIMRLKLKDGSVVDAEDIDFGSYQEALVYEAVTNMGISANTAWEIIKGYDPKSKQVGAVYALGALEAYTYGHNGVKIDGMSKDGFSALLSETQKKTAHRLGEIDSKAKVNAQQDALKKEEATVSKKEQVAKKNGKPTVKKKGQVIYEGERSKLTALQESSLEVLDKVADGLGVTFRIFESNKVKGGKRVYTMPNGKHTNANGWYDKKTGEIWIDLHAGANGEGTIIFTAAHELTHFIRQWSPAKFKIFADFLMEQYGKKGQSVNELIQAQIDKAAINGRTIGWDEAYEEVIADSTETFLRDSNAAEKIAALHEKDAGLANKIKSFIEQMLTKLRKIMSDLGLAPNTPEGEMVSEMTDALEKLHTLWTDALVDAGKTYSAVAKETKTTKGESETFSLRDNVEETKELVSIHEEYVSAQNQYREAKAKYDALKETDEYSEQMQKLSEAKGLDALKKAVEVYKQYEERSGLAKAFQKMNALKNKADELRETEKKLSKELAEKREKAAIEESGLSEADYHRKLAVQEFGYTPYFYDAGYITPNGRMLNFSGEKGKHFGSRGQDHRAIGVIYENVESGSKAMLTFMAEGNIRIMAETPGIDISVTSEPTTEQYDTISRFVTNSKRNGYFCIDFTDAEGHTIGSISYEDSFSPVRVNNDIRHYFKTGEIREQSDIERFLYSERDSNGNELSKGQQEYFKDSKVRDENGNLLVMYHGTPNAGFTKFKSGTYFTQHKWYADRYQNQSASSLRYKPTADNPDTYAVYLNIKKPFDTRNKAERDIFYNEYYRQWGTGTDLMESGLPDWLDGMDLQEFLEEMGYDYDGLILDEGGVGGYGEEVVSRGLSYVVFDPAQVKNIDNKTPTDDPDIRYSDRYSYETLTSKPDMKLTMVGGTLPTNRADVVSQAKKNAASVGKANKDGSVSVHVKDIDTDVVLSTKGLKHSLDRRFDVNAPITLKAGQILQNSIRINELTPQKAEAEKSYILIGAAIDKNGELYVVRSVVNRFSNELTSMDVLYAINAKKGNQLRSMRPWFQHHVTDSTISIAQLLDFVNRYFPDILPESVLRHYGYDARPEGELGEDVLYSDRDSYAPTFYSQMSKVIDDVKLEKMGTSSILNHLKNRGVKNEEIKWSGIETWLEGKKSVTKAELKEFIAGSQLQIQEQKSDAIDIEVFSDDGDNYKVRNKTSGLIVDEWEYSDDVEDGLEGWVNQEGEIAITVDEIREKSYNEFSSTRWSDYKIDGGENYRELVFVMPNSSYSNEAMRTHWGEEAEGVLAHARMQDIETTDGKKMLFIEEIQSDWHNEGHKHGYESDISAEERTEYDELKKKIDALTAQHFSNMDEKAKLDVDYFKNGKISFDEYTEKSTALIEKDDKITAQIHSLYNKKDIISDKIRNSAPDAPFRTTYHEYVLKRLLRMAAEEGYDSLGWTPADIQSDRWSDEYAEGYRIEYDQDIPSFLKKYGKKWGAKVGTAKTTEGYDVWSMDITDSMKDSVLTEGQPMFSERDDFNQAKSNLKNKYKVDVDKVISVADHYLNSYGGSMNKTMFRLQFLNIAEYTAEALTSGNKEAFDKAQKLLVELSGEIVNEPKDIGEVASTLKDIKSYIRKIHIKIPEFNKGDFDVVGGFENFRKRHFGKITLAKNGLDVDSLYPELQEIFGYAWFPEDIITVPDQLMRIAEVVDKPLSAEAQVNYDVDEARIYTSGDISEKIVGIVAESQNNSQDDLLITDRYSEGSSNRVILANALDSVAKNEIERNRLEQYKSKIDLIESEYAKLTEIRAKIRELSFAKGKRDTKAIKSLQFEENQTANRINTYDRQLFNLEATTALKNVLQREKELARRKEAKKGKEALAAYKEKAAKTQRELMKRNQESRKKAIEGRDKTAMRHKIRDIVDDLNKLLLNPTKDKHVPISLQKPVASALAVINMDTVGADERIAKYNDLIAKAKDPDEIARLTKSRDRIEYQGENLKDKLTTLQNAYAALLKSDDPLIKNTHDEAIENLIANTVEKVGETSLRNMSLEQLEAVYDMFKAIKATIRNANKMFKEGKQETITDNSEAVKNEVRAAGGHRDRVLKATKWLKKFGWNMLKPIYAMKMIGSDTLTRLYENVRKGEDTWAVDVNEAKDFFRETASKYNYNSWDFKKQYAFKDSAGHSFSLTIEQIMSLYAWSKREQADKHLEFGGFIFDDSIEVTEKNKFGIPVTYEVNDANPYRLKKDALSKVISILDSDLKDVKGFVDEMQAYLSDVMGAKGNEVSLAMYDIKLYKEQNYFPLKTARYFREFDPEKNGTPKIKNSGFSKNTVPQAGNPIILSNFMDVWANHVNDMSMYHAFVLPLEDFMRVYNYSSTMGGYDSVQQYIKNAYGSQANTYIESLMNDLNGGARTDPATDLIGKSMSLFKKAAVFASASVVVQQPSAIARATAYIDSKYFVDKPEATKHSETWAEVKKYAPVAIIKEMGYFDTNMGRSTVDWIRDEKTWRDKVDDIASKAPAIADELAWCAIWKAVKREVASTTNLKVGSEEFLKKAGERFTEVVTKTQVYDSVLSRSALMRSKDTGAKMVTAFMAEPTTSLNMVVDAVIEGKRGNKKFAAKAIGAVSASIILNSILVSLVTAARDDDEDETYLEKYLESLTAELIDGFNPLTYIPLIKDIWSIAQGYDIERSDMSIWSDLWQSVENLFSENKSGFEKTEGIVGSIASIFGLPLKNIMRDARAMYNLASTLLSGTPTTKAGVGEAIGGAVKDSIPLYSRIEKFVGADDSKSDKLYDAIISGDQAHIDRIKAQYKDDKAIESAIKQGLRENDSRIHEAAQARYDGDIEEYKRIAKEIIAEGYFSQDTVVAAINAEINAIEKGETSEEETTTDDTDKVTSIYTASDINDAFESGDTDMALEVIDDLINTKVTNYLAEARKEAEESGKSFNERKAQKEAESKAKSSIRSSMTSYWKPLYKEAYKSGNTAEKERIERILKASGLYGSASEVIKTCREWRTERD